MNQPVLSLRHTFQGLPWAELEVMNDNKQVSVKQSVSPKCPRKDATGHPSDRSVLGGPNSPKLPIESSKQTYEVAPKTRKVTQRQLLQLQLGMKQQQLLGFFADWRCKT